MIDVFDKDFLRFTIKNDDGTFNETIKIKKTLVGEIKECVDFLKDNCADNIKDYQLKEFIEFCLLKGVDFVLNNKESLIDSGNDDFLVAYTEFFYKEILGDE